MLYSETKIFCKESDALSSKTKSIFNAVILGEIEHKVGFIEITPLGKTAFFES